MEDLRALLANDEGLQLVLQANLLDDGRYDDGISLEQNCRNEIDRLEADQTAFCGAEVVKAFSQRFHVNVTTLIPEVRKPIATVDEGAIDTVVIWYNGVNHYDSVCDFESRHERQHIAKRKPPSPRNRNGCCSL